MNRHKYKLNDIVSIYSTTKDYGVYVGMIATITGLGAIRNKMPSYKILVYNGQTLTKVNELDLRRA